MVLARNPVAKRSGFEQGVAVLARDAGCTVYGCNSTYRLEVHHIVPLSGGGTHTPETSPPSAGGTTTWPYTAGACASTPNPHRSGAGYSPTSRSCGYQPPAPDPHKLAILDALPTNIGRAPP